MAKSLAQRVAATLAKQAKAQQAAEYKAGEPARRKAAGRVAADVRADRRIEDLVNGTRDPRSRGDFAIIDRAQIGEWL